jgi:putative sterol carrier protein
MNLNTINLLLYIELRLIGINYYHHSHALIFNHFEKKPKVVLEYFKIKWQKFYFWPMEIVQIREELAEKVKKIDPIGKRLKFKMDDEFIFIDGRNNVNIVTDNDDEADCTITMSLETYLKLQRKEIKPMMATLTGKLKVKGDIGLAQKLKQLM